jgi:hypothetical protein
LCGTVSGGVTRSNGPSGVLGNVARGKAPNPRIATASFRMQSVAMSEPLIERAEVVALLFNVSDTAVALTTIERLLGGEDGEEEADEG